MERSVRQLPPLRRQTLAQRLSKAAQEARPEGLDWKAGDGGRVLTAADDADAAEKGSALFCQPGGATLPFTASTEGRALCTHD
eukprot:3834209-Pleurochrysis_carterae.AAC.1